MKRLAQLVDSGIVPGDDAALRLKKVALTLVPLIIGPAAFVWGLIYFLLGHPLSGAIPMSYSIISALSLSYYFRTKRTEFLQYSQLLLVLLLPFLLMWSLGGFAAGSMVMIWAIFAPIAALMFLEKWAAIGWFLAFAFLILISVLIDHIVADAFPPLPGFASSIFYLLNLGCGSAGLYLLVSYSINEEKHAIEGLEQAKLEILTAKESLEQRVRERTRELRESEERLLRAVEELRLAASVFSHAREGIVITDAAGAIVEVNDSFTHITGYNREAAVGQNPRILSSGRHEPGFYAAMWQSLVEKGSWDGEIWNRNKNGDIYAARINIAAVRDGNGTTQNYVALFTDITLMKEHQQQLEHTAHYDPLTGQPNRALLADRLQQGIAQARRRETLLALVYLDLDGFKTVNDRHGHETGDELLVAVSQRMKEALRAGDTLARLGGDEFAVVLTDLTTVTECEGVLSRLLSAAAEPVHIGGDSLRVSASLGVTLFPLDDGDADSLLRHADQAMYVAKQAGKNRYHLFDVDQDAAARSRHESLEHIRHALDRREFVLYFQPKVNMKTGTVVGAEALIRWQHPKRGLLLPLDFLPVIEDHPISVELGEWVIDTALTQIGQWNAAGLDIPVSVNVGARQLQQDDFMTRLSNLLATHPEVKPNQLGLEILETSALADVTQISELMYACLALGVGFALDDFGTGYSSLTYLRRLPADFLKIDQSFVLNMIDDPEDLAIVQGVIGLAKAFRRQAIAEGVETIAHGTLLLSLGCELAQGYGIARPMPAAGMPAWVSSWQPDATWTA